MKYEPRAYEPPVEDRRAEMRREYEAQMAGGLSPAQLEKIKASAGPDDVPPMVNNNAAMAGWSYDDRPAVSKAAMHEAAGDAGATPQRYRETDPSASGGNNDEVPAGATGRGLYPPEDELPSPGGARNLEAPEGFNADLPAPEPIASNLTTEAAPVVEAFGEYAAMCLYSKNWMHREAALMKMEQEVARGAVKNDREVFRTMCQSLTRLFKDKVANVFAASCKLLGTAVRHMGPAAGPREVHSSVASLVPQLLEKLGDAHAKVRDAARDAIIELASTELSLVAAPLVKPVRSQSAWRVVLGRLSIMLELIPQHGLAKQGDHGLTLESVMEFTAKTFESPNGEVRSTAVKVTLECCAIAGRAVEKFLPRTLKPAIRDIIDEGLGIKTGVAPPPAQAPSRPRATRPTTPGKPAAPARSSKPASPPRASASGAGAIGAGAGEPTARELRAEIARASESSANLTRTWRWR